MENQEQIPLFDAYYDKILTAEEKTAFEIRLSQEEAFRQEYDHYRAVRDALEAAEVKHLFNEIHEKHQRKKQKRFPYLMAAAASIALLILIAVLLPSNRLTGSEQFLSYFKPYPNLFSFRNATDHPLQKGLEHYSAAQYEQAVSSLILLPENDTARFYLGVSYLALSQAEAGISHLQELNSAPFRDPANWYLLLAYIKQEDYQQALEVIDDNTYQEEDRAKLKKWLLKEVSP